jgi:peptidoglycan/LPS O-acetylase OafA/YrhL
VLVTTQFHNEQLSYSASNTLIAAACAVVLALVVLEPQGLLVRTLELRPLVGLGVISYSLFLWHEPLLLWLGNEGLISSGGAGFAKNLGLAFGLTIVASVATYALVEAPALRLRFHRSREPVPPEQVEAAP